MSNLGVRILYGIINNLPYALCERAFAPAIDLEQALRAHNRTLWSLESRRPLHEFDIVGFSLGHELCYTNVLTMLETGGIPLYAHDRDGSHPLIIGGGPCMMNPEPMHAFFDLFVIGEAEEAMVQIAAEYRAARQALRQGSLSRSDLLAALARIEGVYVPSFYEASYLSSGGCASFEPRRAGLPRRIRKRFVSDLEAAYFPVDWLVPYIQTVHDRVTVEIMRGCPNSCRFCQGRAQYYPLRIRKASTVVSLARQAISCTGYEEVALGGLSVSDYPHLAEVLVPLIAEYRGKGVGVSLASLKPKAMLGELASLIAGIKKTGLTFAPEAGTKRLRALLGKEFDEGDFFATVEAAYRSGYQHVKLYFLIGIPTEQDADLQAIIDFAAKTSELRRKVLGRPAEVHLSVNGLIPKPHTSFQWCAMASPDALARAQGFLRDAAKKNRRLRISFHHREMSFLEGVLSRGDRRLSGAIARAYALGARFDAWDEHFDLGRWQKAFADNGIAPYYYLQGFDPVGLLPWDFLDLGVSQDSLREEFIKHIAIK